MSLLAKILNKAPVPYVSRSAGFAWTTGRHEAGMRSQLRSMGTVGTLFAIVNRTSTSVAAAKWRLYRQTDDPANRVEVTRHVALDTWRKPNPFMTCQEFVEIVQQHLDLTGEGWWITSSLRGMGIPGELWPVRPDRMSPVPSPTEFLTGYIYIGPDGDRIPLKLDQVTQLRMPNPEDPYRGMGPVQALMVDLDASRYSAEWNRNFFLNSAEPGGLIEVESRLSDEEFDEMSMRWNEQHRGVANAHRVAIIEQGKWKDRAFSMRDMQFAELRAVSRDVIMEAFGISKATLGMTDGVNFAAAKAARVQFAELLTVPRLERWKAALNNDFLPAFGAAGQGVEFDYDSPVGEDDEAANAERDSKVGAVVALVGAGFDAPAVLEAFDMPELPYSKPEPPPMPGVVEGEVVEPPKEIEARLRHHTAELGAPLPRMADEIDLTEMGREWQRALESILDKWKAIEAAQRAQLVRQIIQSIKDGDLPALSTLDVDLDDAAAKLAEALDALASLAAARVVREAAAQGATVAPVVPEEGAGMAITIAGMLAASLALAAGREALRLQGSGLSADAVGAAVKAYLAMRSDTDARTSIGAALTGTQNQARVATMRSGPVASIYASEVLDRVTCGPCRAIHGRFMGLTDDGIAMAEVDRLWGPLGGYIDCEGGIRCRGTVTGVWRPTTTRDLP